jgi:hypothetical protein
VNVIRGQPQHAGKAAYLLPAGREAVLDKTAGIRAMGKKGFSVGHIPHEMIDKVHIHSVRVAPDLLDGERMLVFV